MADIQTNVAVGISPLINADAETFKAEFDWPGGIPAPSVELKTGLNLTETLANATLAIDGAMQSYQFTNASVSPYTFLILAIGLTVDRGTLNAAEFATFWEQGVNLTLNGNNINSQRYAEFSGFSRPDPSYLSSVVKIVDFPSVWNGSWLINGEDLAGDGPSIALEVQTWVAATGQDTYPYFYAIGWQQRVAGIGALRVPGMFMRS